MAIPLRVGENFSQLSAAEPFVAAAFQVQVICDKRPRAGMDLSCVWQLHLAHFGSLIWPTLIVSGLRTGF